MFPQNVVKRDQAFCDLFGGAGLLNVPVGVHSDQTDEAIGYFPCHLQNDRSSHGVSDQDKGLELKLLSHCYHVIGKGTHRPGCSPQFRLPMTRQVQGHHRMVLTEIFQLLVPIALIAGPTMNKNQGWNARAVDLIVDDDTIR